MKKHMFAVACAAIALAACAPQAPPAVEAPAVAAPVLPTAEDVSAAYARFDAAIAAKDAAAITAIYAPGAVMFLPDQNDLLKNDPAKMTEGVTEWLKTEPKITPNVAETQILDADTFVQSGVITVDVKRGGHPAFMTERYTQVWQKQADGQWSIVAEHMSAMPKPLRTRLAAIAGAAQDAVQKAATDATAAPAPAPK